MWGECWGGRLSVDLRRNMNALYVERNSYFEDRSVLGNPFPLCIDLPKQALDQSEATARLIFLSVFQGVTEAGAVVGERNQQLSIVQRNGHKELETTI